MIAAKKRLPPRSTPGGETRQHRFFRRRGRLDLTRDRSGHRRFAAMYDDLLS